MWIWFEYPYLSPTDTNNSESYKESRFTKSIFSSKPICKVGRKLLTLQIEIRKLGNIKKEITQPQTAENCEYNNEETILSKANVFMLQIYADR